MTKILNLSMISFSFLSIFFLSSPSYAGTAGYFAKCTYQDYGRRNGGNVYKMPCYAIEGGNQYSVFFHILWRDGVKTMIEAQPVRSPFADRTTGKTYKRVERNKLVADDDGDVITLDEMKYTDLRYDIQDPNTLKILKSR